jgi:hypothetical protein
VYFLVELVVKHRASIILRVEIEMVLRAGSGGGMRGGGMLAFIDCESVKGELAELVELLGTGRGASAGWH